MTRMRINETLKELLIGIAVYGVAAEIICLIIGYDILHVSAGLWIGVLVAAGMVIHMDRALEDALDLGEQGALAHIRKTYLIRSIVVFVVLGAVVYFEIGNVFTVFAGVMSLKLSAYMQPAVHKLITLKKS